MVKRGNAFSGQSPGRHVELVVQRLGRVILSRPSQTRTVYRSLRPKIPRCRNRFDLLQHSAAAGGRKLARQDTGGFCLYGDGPRRHHARKGAQELSGGVHDVSKKHGTARRSARAAALAISLFQSEHFRLARSVRAAAQAISQMPAEGIQVCPRDPQQKLDHLGFSRAAARALRGLRSGGASLDAAHRYPRQGA